MVHTGDVSRRALVRVPWDCPQYGYESGKQRVIDAVRASTSFLCPAGRAAARTFLDRLTHACRLFPMMRAACSRAVCRTLTPVPRRQPRHA